MPLFTFNLVKVQPESSDGVPAFYSSNFNTGIVSKLRKGGLLVSGIGSDYASEKEGVYIFGSAHTEQEIKETAKALLGSEIPLETVSIRPNSYLIRFILYDKLVERVAALYAEDKLYCPANWNQFGELQFCQPDLIRKSVPNGLFVLRKCFSIRVEHVDDELYLQLDIRLRRFSNLRLDRIEEILKGKGLSFGVAIKNLKCSVKLKAGRRVQGYIIDGNNADSMIIRTESGDVTEPASSVTLNATFLDVRDFIIKTLGESLLDIESVVRRDIKMPFDTISSIKRELQYLNSQLFPLELGGHRYSLDTELKQVEIPSSDSQGVLF